MMRRYEALPNLKHRMMLSLIYACVLRRSELLNLQLSDVQSDRGLLLIRQAKGKKDRVVPLSAKLLESLRQYYVQYRPQRYVFEGQDGGQYSEASLAKVLKTSLERAGINKPVPCTGCDTVMPHTCWKAEPIYVTFRNCWGITAAELLKFIPMLAKRTYKLSAAHSTICELTNYLTKVMLYAAGRTKTVEKVVL